jgi:hypothetical protein
MSKFHINKNGVPAPCHAQQGNCPLGGADQHFSTKEEAQAFADKENKQAHSLLPELNQSPPKRRERNLRKQLEHEMRLFIREKVRIEFNGCTLEGGVSKVDFGTDPAFIVRDEEKTIHRIPIRQITSLTSLKKKNLEQVGDTLAKAISKEPYFLVEENAEGAKVVEYTPKNYNMRDKWDNMHITREDAEAQANMKTQEKQEATRIANEISEFSSKHFYRKPYMKTDMLYKHKEDLAEIEREINNALKKEYPGFQGIDFCDVNAGGIQIRGHHKEIDGYSYGHQPTIKYDFSNKDEVAKEFIESWKAADNEKDIESQKNFISFGEKYGWD